MKYTTAKFGRVFVVRLEDGEVIHKQIESFAREKKISCAGVIFVGGAQKGSEVVVGPKKGNNKEIIPMKFLLRDIHETGGVGTIFPNEKGEPVLHMHNFFGRKNKSVCGCVRKGIKVWLVGEAIIFELKSCSAKRRKDKKSGFELLRC